MSQEKFYIQDIPTEDLIYDLSVLIRQSARISIHDFSRTITIIGDRRNSAAIVALTPYLYYSVHIIHELSRRNRLPDKKKMEDMQFIFYGEKNKSLNQHVKEDAEYYENFLTWINTNKIIQEEELDLGSLNRALPGGATDKVISDFAKPQQRHARDVNNSSRVLKSIWHNGQLVSLAKPSNTKQNNGLKKNDVNAKNTEYLKELEKGKDIVREYEWYVKSKNSYSGVISGFGPISLSDKISVLEKVIKAIEKFHNQNDKDFLDKLKSMHNKFQFIKNNSVKISSVERYLHKVANRVHSKSIKLIINRLYEDSDNIDSKILLNLIEQDDRFKRIEEKINKRLEKFSGYILKKIQQYDKDLDKAIKTEKEKSPVNPFEIDLLQAKKTGIDSIIDKFKGENKNIKDKMTHIKEGLKELEDIHDVLFAKRANSFFDAISGRRKWNEIHSSDSEYSSGFESFSDSEEKTNSDINPLRMKILNYLNHRPKSFFDYFRPASKGEKLYEKIHEVAEKKLGIGKF